MKAFWLEKEQSWIRYIDTVSGDVTLVFVHGLGSSSIADFSELASDKKLAGFRCVFIDLPGHGFSDRPKNFSYDLYDYAHVVERLIEHLGLKKIVLIGHSMGGTIAIAFSQKRADLLSQLILLEPNLDPGIGSGSKIIASYDEQTYLASGHSKYLSNLKSAAHASLSSSLYYGTFAIANPLAIHRSAVGLLKGTIPPQRQVLKVLQVPKTYIVGEININEVPKYEIEALGFCFSVVPKAGHAMMHDNPNDFRDLLCKSIVI